MGRGAILISAITSGRITRTRIAGTQAPTSKTPRASNQLQRFPSPPEIQAGDWPAFVDFHQNVNAPASPRAAEPNTPACDTPSRPPITSPR